MAFEFRGRLEKPCPFCGTDNLYEIEMMEDFTGNAVPGIFCNCCKVEFYHEDDSMEMAEEAVKKDLADKLIKVWNKRPERPTAQERPHGKWVKTGGYLEGAYADVDYFACSECKFEVPIESDDFWNGDYSFCPHCGANMYGAAE